MDYPPNEAAALRVIRRILPAIRTELPGASFHVVGRNPTADLLAAHGQNGVHVWGRVRDIRGWIKAANVALIPLEIARGIQNKVLEAMAMEVPVVLTPAAATGIAATPNQHVVLGESDAELAEAVARLAYAPREARAIGLAARQFVVEQQSWASTLATLTDIVRPPLTARHVA
jgi:glycosyltransferase involved in cell wall biosynthesis